MPAQTRKKWRRTRRSRARSCVWCSRHSNRMCGTDQPNQARKMHILTALDTALLASTESMKTRNSIIVA